MGRSKGFVLSKQIKNIALDLTWRTNISFDHSGIWFFGYMQQKPCCYCCCNGMPDMFILKYDSHVSAHSLRDSSPQSWALLALDLCWGQAEHHGSRSVHRSCSVHGEQEAEKMTTLPSPLSICVTSGGASVISALGRQRQVPGAHQPSQINQL